MSTDRPARPQPTFVSPASVHPLTIKRLTDPPSTAHLMRTPPALPKDHPEVADGVAELEALLAPSLTPTEVAFHEEQRLAKLQAGADAYRDRAPPKNFLQAHMVIIEQLLMNPGITTTALSTATGYSRNWLHKVMSSDAFQAKLAEKQKALIDPIVMATITDRIKGLASRSLEVLEERMEGEAISMDTALEVFQTASKALGLGAQKAAAPLVQQFVVHVPPRMASATEWASTHSGRPAEVSSEPLTIDPSTLESDPAP